MGREVQAQEYEPKVEKATAAPCSFSVLKVLFARDRSGFNPLSIKLSRPPICHPSMGICEARWPAVRSRGTSVRSLQVQSPLM
jgi:hypothetical protein